MKTKLLLASCLASLLALMSLIPAHCDQTVQIAAAANLTKVFTDDIIPAFAKKTGITILPTFGATGILAKQLENGAPYELFVSADTATIEKLKQENLLQPNSCKTYAVGQLVLWSKSLSVTTQGLSLLTTPSVTNIAVANPQTAPYGAAAIETLTKANLLTAVQPKIVYAETVSQAFQFAQTGNADVGFTALSLVLGVSGGTYMVIPSKLHSPIEQAVGLVVKASPQAKEFEDFLFSKEGRKMFAADGYLPPPRPH